jgi:hypothetical protein
LIKPSHAGSLLAIFVNIAGIKSNGITSRAMTKNKFFVKAYEIERLFKLNPVSFFATSFKSGKLKKVNSHFDGEEQDKGSKQEVCAVFV